MVRVQWGSMEKDSEEQDVIAWVKLLRDKGLTLAAIVGKQNADEVPARGKRWHLTSVTRILKRAG
jgi:hypothetical protein